MSNLSIIRRLLGLTGSRTDADIRQDDRKTVASFPGAPVSRLSLPEASPKRNEGHHVQPLIDRVLEEIRCRTPVILIHGRAGTGKTTLIKKVIEKGKLNHVVVAPTGVAALNAGGQTIHSFFGIAPHIVNLSEIEPRAKLMSILRRIDFLVIDEISMVRADLLDAIDQSLEVNRATGAPFGGVPIIMVGDFLQLPPIVDREEGVILEALGYETVFAFGARSLRNVRPKLFELKAVYRQKELEFIDLLSKIRLAQDVPQTVAKLNQRCYKAHRPSAVPLTLTARRQTTERHNRAGLAALPGKIKTYTGQITGNFVSNDRDNLPSPEFLDLKVGSRVMFTKNDSEKRWVNGSLGTVVGFGDAHVAVQLDGSSLSFDVAAESWEKVRQEWNHAEKKVVATVIAKYSQIPLTPAWAMTIHKAQGLTLSDVRIDLEGGAFSPGQTYVALSRATTIDGLSFNRELAVGDIKFDPNLITGVSQFSS